MTLMAYVALIAAGAAGALPLVTRRTNGTVRAVPAALANVGLVLLFAAVVIPAYGHLTGSYRLVPVLSGSMAPGMPEGDAAWVEPVSLSDLETGDVFVFTAPEGHGGLSGKPVIHRIIETVDPGTVIDPQPGYRYFRTRGDAVESADPWILAVNDQQVWRRTGVVPDAGHLITLVSNMGTRTVIVFPLAALLVLFGFRTIRSALRELAPTQPHVRTPRASTRWQQAGAALIAGGITATAVGAYAAFTADQEHGTGAFTSGVVSLAIDQGTNRMTVAFEDLTPGQTIERAITLTHTGTVPLYGAGTADPVDAIGMQLDITNPTPSPLTTDRSDGLQTRVLRCSVPWTEAIDPNGLYTYSCPGIEHELVDDQPILGRRDLPHPPMASYSPAGADHLVFQFRLPDTAPSAYQDLTTTVDLNIVGIQRDGIIK